MKISSFLFTADSKIDVNHRPLESVYRPLKNLSKNGQLDEFTTSSLNLDLTSSTEVLAYPSYDGSVNLFITDGINDPFVINSGFAKKEDNSCTLVQRIGENNTNEYNDNIVKGQTKLFTVVNKYPKIFLQDVGKGGQLTGGNYTLYFKYADKDGNKTDFVGESGIISIFNGDWKSISTVCGTLAYERTDKYISVKLTDVDQRFSKLYVYAHWSSCDLSGEALSSTYEFVEPFDIILDDTDSCIITIYGTENIKPIDASELNIQYNVYSNAKTQTTVQNMLFLGNLGYSHKWLDKDGKTLDSLDLSKATLSGIKTTCVQKEQSIGYVNGDYQDKTDNGGEYYNPHNIYNWLGYWPDEMYRFGIVYIFNDGSRSQVFNLLGGDLSKYDFIDDTISETNDSGVFRTPDCAIIDGSTNNPTVKPLAFQFEFKREFINTLKTTYGVNAYYFVRQKRIPITIAQGLSIGVNRNTGVPTPLVYEKRGYARTYPYQPWFETSGVGLDTKEENSINPDFVIHGNYYKCESFVSHPYERYDKDHWKSKFITGGDQNHTKIQDLGNSHFNHIMPAVSKTTRDFNVGHIQGLTDANVAKQYSNWPIESTWNYIYADNEERILWGEYLSSNLHYGLLCADAYCVPNVREIVNGELYLSEYLRYYNGGNSTIDYKNRQVINDFSIYKKSQNPITKKYLVKYIGESHTKQTLHKHVDNPLKKYKSDELDKVSVFFPFTTKIGDGNSASDCTHLYIDRNDPQIKQFFWGNKALKDANDLIRGNWSAFLGIVPEDATCFPVIINKDGVENAVYYGYDTSTTPSTLYNIRSVDLTDTNRVKLEFDTRINSNDPYFAVSDIYSVNEKMSHEIYRGDCFTCTTSTRMQWNHVDSTVAVSDSFVDVKTWRDHFNGLWGWKEGSNDEINRGDINSIQLGYWLTYKSLSNYNLGLRSEDPTNKSEFEKLGTKRSFYPFRGPDRSSGNKMPDSNKFNIGYSSISSLRKNIGWKETPYENFDYTNRVAFSNIQISKAFENNFKVFQALSYQDIDSTYGDIVKFEPYGSDIFCVFEHGCGIIPINEKALMQTTTGENIHIYGAGVIPEKITVVSPHYGSTWHDSIITTPNGIYGVDTECNKIWKFTGKQFTIISDMRVQRFLEENMIVANNKHQIGKVNVKTHYNASKGDLMFTFYNELRSWNLCYNELLDMFICKYTWIPLESATIYNDFYSLPLTSEFNKIYKHGIVENPTYWYDEQHPFEIEFVVSQPTGIQKIYDNLVILSNNVQPDSLEITITGDNYDFTDITEFPNVIIKNDIKVSTTISKDTLSDDTLYTLNQKCLNIKDWGRRIGNIEHKEDVWYATLQPITIKTNLITSQTRIRGMWAKVRIKYTGKELATITSIMTLLRLSHG